MKIDSFLVGSYILKYFFFRFKGIAGFCRFQYSRPTEFNGMPVISAVIRHCEFIGRLKVILLKFFFIVHHSQRGAPRAVGLELRKTFDIRGCFTGSGCRYLNGEKIFIFKNFLLEKKYILFYYILLKLQENFEIEEDLWMI